MSGPKARFRGRQWQIAFAAMLYAASASGQLGVIPTIDLFSEDPTGGRRPPGRFGTGDQQWQRDAQKALDESPHLLVFSDWRQFRGRLVAITPTEVVWWSKETNAPLRFPLAEVRKIQLESIGDNASRLPEGMIATLKCAGADWLAGEVTTAADGNFDLRLDLRATLHIPRRQVAWIYFGWHRWPGVGFAGSALDLTDWLPRLDPPEIAGDTVIVRDGGWTGISPDLPGRFELDFELPAESEEGTRLWLQPYDTMLDVFGPGTTMVRFGRKEIQWQNHSEERVHHPITAADEKRPVAYRVFYDQTDYRVIVLRNGEQVATWVLSKEIIDMGLRAFCFQHEPLENNATLQFRGLRLQPWNGIVPAGDADGSIQDQFAIGRSGIATGHLESITSKDFVFSGQSHRIEAETVIRLGEVPVAPGNPVARVETARQGAFNARQLEIRDGQLHCDTVFAGPIQMPADLIYTLLFTPAHESTGSRDTLVFRNGDEIAGHLIDAEINAPIRWKLLSGQEVTIGSSGVAGIRLAGRGGPDAQKPSASIELRNGDFLRGRLLALNAKEAQFEHPILGPLHLDRTLLWQAFLSPAWQPVEGGDRSWSHGAVPGSLPLRNVHAAFDRWIYLDGTYIVRNCESDDYCNSQTWQSVRREVPPEWERFELRYYATADSPSITSALMRLTSPDSGTGWQASLHQNILQLNTQGPRVHATDWRTIAMENAPEESATCRSVRVFVDTKVGTSDFYINGSHVGRIGQQEEERLSPGHFAVQILPHPYESGPRPISSIWLRPWNGELPRTGGATEPTTILRNGDVLPGVAQAFHGGPVTVESDAGSVEIPVEKLAELDFGGALAPERAPGRLRLVDGSSINVDRFHWDGHTVIAHSNWLGDLRLPAETVSELVYRPKPVLDPMAVGKPPTTSDAPPKP